MPSKFSVVPARALFDTRLVQDDITLLTVVCMYINEDGYCYPSLETISNIYSPITGRDKPYDKSSMSKKIDRLESFGYVVKVKQQTTESGSFRSNLWRVIHDRELPKEFNRKSTVEKTTGKILDVAI